MPTIYCPKCGGANPYSQGAPKACQYCGTLVPVPEELRAATAAPPAAPAATPIIYSPQQEQQINAARSMALRWFLIIFLVGFVVPTCLGVGVSVFAALLGVLAPILALLLTF